MPCDIVLHHSTEHLLVAQGLKAFKLYVQLSHDHSDKEAKAEAKYKKQLVKTSFGMWQQYTVHSKELQFKVATAVAAVNLRRVTSVFFAWRTAAIVRKKHRQKVRQTGAINVDRWCRRAEDLCSKLHVLDLGNLSHILYAFRLSSESLAGYRLCSEFILRICRLLQDSGISLSSALPWCASRHYTAAFWCRDVIIDSTASVLHTIPYRVVSMAAVSAG